MGIIRVYSGIRAVTLTASFFLIFGCNEDLKWVKKIEGGDFSIVEKGRALYPIRKIESPSDYDDLIKKIRWTIEDKPGTSEKIAQHFFPEIPNGLDFQYDFSSLDEKNEKVILRYFARIPNPEVFSGVAIQFVMDLERREVVKIYVIQVPLE